MDIPDVLPLHSRSASHARQRARFLSPCLREFLAHSFQARLTGSWATNEAHLPLPVGDRIYSLSDVDVLIDGPPTVDKSTSIVRSVLKLASWHGVEISKVSVRCRSEIDAFWNPCRVSALAENRLEAGHFLTFWALIGAIEALSSSPADSVRDGRAYVLIKFFFKLCRNVLLIQRRCPASYRELTTEVFARLIAHPGVLCAYAIKRGREITLSSTDCEAMLSDSNWEPLTDTLIDARSSDLLANLRRDFRTWYGAGTSLDLESYLAQIKTFDKSPELLPACTKVIQDYERRNAISAA